MPVLVFVEALVIYGYILSIPYADGWFRLSAQGIGMRPFVHRVLVPQVSQFLEWISGVDILYCSMLVVGMSAVGFYLANVYLHHNEMMALIAFQVLVLVTFYQFKIYDYTTAFFFALMLALLKYEKHSVFLAVFPLATLNRETTALITIFYAVWFWGKLPVPRYILNIGIQLVSFLAIELVIQFHFSDYPKLPVWYTLPETIKSFPLIPIFIIIILFSVRSNAFFRTFVSTVFFAQVILYFVAGMPYEIRVFAESVVVIPVLLNSFSTMPSSSGMRNNLFRLFR